MFICITAQFYTLIRFSKTMCVSLTLLSPLLVSDFAFDVLPKQRQSGILFTATYWSGSVARAFGIVAHGQGFFLSNAPD